MERMNQNLAIARGFTALDEAGRRSMPNKCLAASADGRFELYKVSLKFDNAEARRAHDFPIPQQMEGKAQLDYAAGKGNRK